MHTKMAFKEKLRSFAVDLFKIDAIKFGDFVTKIGVRTPVYCDLRVIISYPKVMDNLCDLLSEYMDSLPKYDVICGVPYTALPIATAVSVKTGIPMVMRRKEPKDYGTKQLIEGKFRADDRCLIIEDVVTSGSSIVETVEDLSGAGLKCTDAVVVLNREQGGADILKNNGITMHALFTLTEMITILKDAQQINDATVKQVEEYIKSTQLNLDVLEDKNKRLTLALESRLKFADNPIAQKLINIMTSKKTTLCVAADLTSATDILNLAETIGPHICLLKTHIDIIDDYHENFMKHLKGIAEKHNFLLFEDCKFADIGETVRLQFIRGVHKISSWANIVTCHSLMGKGPLDALKQTPGEKGVFLLAEASAAGNLINEAYKKETVKIAKNYPDLVIGFVCQSPLCADKPGLLQLTPGIKIDATVDSLGQRYDSPESVVLERGADIAVVGRGITKAADPEAAAIEYKTLLWSAYLKRIQTS